MEEQDKAKLQDLGLQVEQQAIEKSIASERVRIEEVKLRRLQLARDFFASEVERMEKLIKEVTDGTPVQQ
jgi:uncharacterized protein (DUF3084 family)